MFRYYQINSKGKNKVAMTINHETSDYLGNKIGTSFPFHPMIIIIMMIFSDLHID